MKKLSGPFKVHYFGEMVFLEDATGKMTTIGRKYDLPYLLRTTPRWLRNGPFDPTVLSFVEILNIN